MGVMASQITSLTIVHSVVYSGADQRKHQSSASLAFVRGIHWWPVNSPHKWPVTRKMFPFYDVIMWIPCSRFAITGPQDDIVWCLLLVFIVLFGYIMHFWCAMDQKNFHSSPVRLCINAIHALYVVHIWQKLALITTTKHVDLRTRGISQISS